LSEDNTPIVGNVKLMVFLAITISNLLQLNRRLTFVIGSVSHTGRLDTEGILQLGAAGEYLLGETKNRFSVEREHNRVNVSRLFRVRLAPGRLNHPFAFELHQLGFHNNPGPREGTFWPDQASHVPIHLPLPLAKAFESC
jgi:hypothetical protein